jgi:hypothetical protein
LRHVHKKFSDGYCDVVIVTQDKPLPSGQHRFRPIVSDDAGNVRHRRCSKLLFAIRKPAAVLDAPRQVEAGQSFQLPGLARLISVREDRSLSMDDAVLKNSSETYTRYHRTVTAFAARRPEISFGVRHSRLDQQIK